MNIAGVVILYYPNKEVISNILSYLPELDHLYVLDNSEKTDKAITNIIKRLPKTYYISFGKNTGISYALNYALNEAKASGCDFLLTMDQDSAFPGQMLSEYKQRIFHYEKLYPGTIGMYCVDYIGKVDLKDGTERFVDIAITSGSILPIKIALENGGFDENLFIDEVDSEYCFRIRKNGFHILEFPQIKLNHNLGNPCSHCFLGYHFITFNYNPIRRYYITRNKIYVIKKYPELRYKYIKMLIKGSIFVLLGEKKRPLKFLMILKGIKDGILNRMGQYS